MATSSKKKRICEIYECKDRARYLIRFQIEYEYSWNSDTNQYLAICGTHAKRPLPKLWLNPELLGYIHGTFMEFE